MRVRARKGGEVAPPHCAAGLLLQAGEHAGVGEPVHGVHTGAATTGEGRLDGDSADEGGVEGTLEDHADLVVIDTRVAVMVSVVKTSAPERRFTAASLKRLRSAPRWNRDASADSPSY